MKALSLLVLSCAFALGGEFCVATYNVENLFDDKKDGTEYREFVPSKYGYSAEEANNKLSNVARVIRDLNVSVMALQEVENEALIKRLKNELGYKFYAFSKNEKAAFGVGVLSNIEIEKTQSFRLKGYDRFRPILHVKIKDNEELISLSINHFPSLNNPQRTRIAYSNALSHYAKSSGEKKQILLGDFNTPDYENSPLDLALGKNVYDLWNELSPKNRWNYVYQDERNALDRVFVSKELLNSDKGARYKKGSFEVFRAKYLLNSKNAPKGNFMGFSDHLPLRFCLEMR